MVLDQFMWEKVGERIASEVQQGPCALLNRTPSAEATTAKSVWLMCNYRAKWGMIRR